MKTPAMHNLPYTMRSQRGLSLVELMISLTIGLVLLLGITTLIVQQNQTRNELEKASRQIENGRYAAQALRDDIQHAGFYGQYYSVPAPQTAQPDPCLTTPLTGVTSLEDSLSLPIQGYNGVLPDLAATTGGLPFTCALDGANAANNANNYLAGTDILVIRRADSSSIDADDVNDGRVYIQSTTTSHLLGIGRSTATFTLTNNTSTTTGVAGLRELVTHVYFISPCSQPAGGGASCTGSNDDNGRPIPTLKRLELDATGGATVFTLTPLVEGIENLQLDYGIDTNDDGYPDSYATTAADWSDVMAVRINLLARNTECTTGHTDTKTYNLGLAGTVSAPASDCTNGGYKRHVFSEVARAINPSGRRAQQ